jgi:hypothetical protein
MTPAPRAAIQAGDLQAVRAWIDDQAMAPQLRHACELLVAELDRFRTPGFHDFVAVVDRWLEHYPADIFTGESGALGPAFVASVRAAREKLRADVDARPVGGAS